MNNGTVLYLRKGDHYRFEIDIRDAEGIPYAMADTDVLTLTVKELPSEESDIVLSASGEAGSNVIELEADAEVGVYSGDLTLNTEDGRKFTLWPAADQMRVHGRVENLRNVIIDPEVI